MSNRLYKLPTIKVIPGVSGVSGREASCHEVSEIIGYRMQSSGTWRRVMSMRTVYRKGYPPYTTWGWRMVYTPPRRVPVYRTWQVCWPAIQNVAAVPTTLVKNASNNWEGGARSVALIKPSHFIEVDIRDSPVAIMIGLHSRGMVYGFSSLDHGVIVRTGSVTPVTKGVEGAETQIAAGKVRVVRHADKIMYYAGSEKILEVQSSEDGDLYAYALLHSIGDYVENPFIGEAVIVRATADISVESGLDKTPRGLSELKIQTQAVALDGDRALSKGESSIRVETMGAAHSNVLSEGISVISLGMDAGGYGGFGNTARKGKRVTQYGGMSYSAGALAVVGVASSVPFAKAHGFFPSPRVDGRIYKPEIEPATAEGIFPVTSVVGYIASGEIASGSATLAAMGKASEGGYFGGTVEVYQWPQIGGGFDERAEGHLVTYDPVDALDFLELDTSVMFGFIETVGALDSIDIYLILNVAFNEFLLANDSISFSALLELMIREKVSIAADTSVAKREALQYAVNAVTGALSQYQNFGFKQFATSGGNTYAITDTGVFLLSGESDDNDKINASIDFGASDFGTAHSKRVSSVYAGLSTDGEAYIRVSGDNGESTVYKAVSHGAESRAKTAKGLSARHWRVALELTDASYADLDNIEVEIGVSQRRLRGRVQ